MRFLHTADWHIGQLFHEYDRTREHQAFLNWLITVINTENIDVLLVSGDIFDTPNPSAQAIRMFYTFLKDAILINPSLQIVITAGNHDSAIRLETPVPLLANTNIHIIGTIPKNTDGNIDYEKLLIPLRDKNNNIAVWCMAVPFLKNGDYPVIKNADNPYLEGVTTFYKELLAYAITHKSPETALITMGHLHVQQAEVTGMDDYERKIMGGLESIKPASFGKEVLYVALGHIHKAQHLEKVHIRYSGSPIPMSFSEQFYEHQVVYFEINDKTLTNMRLITVPVTVPLLSIPTEYGSIEDALRIIAALPAGDPNDHDAPYTEIKILLNGPEPSLRYKLNQAITGKKLKLTKIDIRYHSPNTSSPHITISEDILKSIHPSVIFEKIYQEKYGNEAPPTLKALFNEIVQEAEQKY